MSVRRSAQEKSRRNEATRPNDGRVQAVMANGARLVSSPKLQRASATTAALTFDQPRGSQIAAPAGIANSLGITPTTIIFRPFTRIGLPMIAGSEPNPRSHSSRLRTTTGEPVGWKSSPENSRPSTARTPLRRRNSCVMDAPWTVSIFEPSTSSNGAAVYSLAGG